MAICTTCKSDVPRGNFGYCDPCLEVQEVEAEFTDKPSLGWLQEYTADRRKEVEELLSKKDLVILNRDDVNGLVRSGKYVVGIISPTFAPHVDYSLIRGVRYVREADVDTIAWLKQYWYTKYELDVPDFDHEVGLIFESESEYGYYTRVYDFPGSMIQMYCMRTVNQ